MLRRKFMLTLVPLVILLLVTAVVAISLLQGVLQDLNRVQIQAWGTVEHVNDLSITINAIESELYQLQYGKEWHLDKLIDSVEEARREVDQLERSHLAPDLKDNQAYATMAQKLPEFEREVGMLATVQDETLRQQYTEKALASAVALREATLPLSRSVRDHARDDQASLSAWFRWVVLGLAIVFLLLINISVIVLLRIAALILGPVETLVAATRELGREHFEYRVNLDRHDEFDDLGRAYNDLASRLQSNEQRKIEVLQQVAVAINHELNNALSIIELQLKVLSRQAGQCPALEKCLKEIHESLERVTGTVHQLKEVRRIVLTEYAPGMKMLDLAESTR